MIRTRKISTIFAATAIALASIAAVSVDSAKAADINGSISPSGVSFTENSATPAFTFTTPALATSAPYTRMSLSISAGAPPTFTYWSVIQSCPTSPGAPLLCGINAITVNSGSGAAAVTGVTATRLGDTVGLTFPSQLASGSIISVSFDIGAFTVGAAGTYKLVLAPSTATVTDDRAVLDITSVASGGGGGSTTPSASITLGAAQGQLVAGSPVAIVASGLQTTAPYSVTVESNPQLLTPANATATNGAVNTTVTLPANLGAGWHTLTFRSTAADGSAVTSVLYFEISATGTLLGTSTTKPATLAQTGFEGFPLTAAALALVMLGAGSAVLARRRRTS